MRVAFHSNQLGLRGTEIALFDYAHHNERILGNESVIITDRNARFHDVKAIQKFGSRFPVFAYQHVSELDAVLAQSGAEVLYCIKAGVRDEVVSKNLKTAVHAVFQYYEPHGNVYAYVSEWLSKHMTGSAAPFVPHMIDLPRTDENLRLSLGIPPEAIVFGRHGGYETFDLDFVREAVVEVASAHPQRYFLFLNTESFGAPLPNLKFLEGTADPLYKVKFINTCNAMLHGRRSGETFGLAVGEFSVCNKPVLTWSGSVERSHIELLGAKGFYYSEKSELLSMLHEPPFEANGFWDCYSDHFSPERVMVKFREVFL
jgi:hypothetical protein